MKRNAPYGFLTNYDLGGTITVQGVQEHLDFSSRTPELFSGVAMGEDARKVLASYLVQMSRLKVHVSTTIPLHKHALAWARKMQN